MFQTTNQNMIVPYHPISAGWKTGKWLSGEAASCSICAPNSRTLPPSVLTRWKKKQQKWGDIGM